MSKDEAQNYKLLLAIISEIEVRSIDWVKVAKNLDLVSMSETHAAAAANRRWLRFKEYQITLENFPAGAQKKKRSRNATKRTGKVISGRVGKRDLKGTDIKGKALKGGEKPEKNGKEDEMDLGSVEDSEDSDSYYSSDESSY